MLTWKDGAVAAYSINHDDNFRQHVAVAVPTLTAAGLRGTFHVNPGRDTWESLRHGYIDAADPRITPVEMVSGVVLAHELGSHTMEHKRFKYYPSDYEGITPETYHQYFGPDVYGYGEPNLYTEAQVFELMRQDCLTIIDYLDSIQPRATVIMAYPYGDRNAASRALAMQYYLATRGGYLQPRMTNPESPADMSLVGGYGTGALQNLAMYTEVGPQEPVEAVAYDGYLDQIRVIDYEPSWGHAGELIHVSGGDPPFLAGWYLVVDVDVANAVYLLAENCTLHSDAGAITPGALTGMSWANEAHCDTLFARRTARIKEEGGWFVETWHEQAIGADPNYPREGGVHGDSYTRHISALAADPELWVAPVGGVVRYIYSRDAVCVTVTRVSFDRVELTVDDGLDDLLFDTPVTLKTRIPIRWLRGVTVTHAGRPVDVDLTYDGNEAFAVYSVVPDGRPVVIAVSPTMYKREPPRPP